MASPDRQAAFQAFDFESSLGWLDYKVYLSVLWEGGNYAFPVNADHCFLMLQNNLTIPPGRNEASVLDRYKQKFYKLHVVSSFL